MSDKRVNLPGFRELFPEYVRACGQHPTNGNAPNAPPPPPQYYSHPLPPMSSQQNYVPPPPPVTSSVPLQARTPYASSSGTLSPATWDDEHEGSQPVPEHKKRYACHLCEKRFVRPSSLETHMNSHTGDKPYSCTFSGCTKAFSVKSNMQRHLKTHQY